MTPSTRKGPLERMPIHGFHFRFRGEADVDRSSLLANRDANDPMYGPAVRSKKILTSWW